MDAKELEKLTANEINNFVARCQTICDNHNAKQGFKTNTLELQIAKKYYKIWTTSGYGGTSIYAFVSKATGEVFKPAGVNAPAKHARGSIHDSNIETFMGWHGPAYLKQGRTSAEDIAKANFKKDLETELKG